VAHVELSLSELPDPAPGRAQPGGTLGLWSFAVEIAPEPCVLLDAGGVVVAASPGCGALFGIEPAEAIGLRLVDEVLRLLDFNAVSGELRGWEVDMIPPLLAISSGGLARGLVRVSGGSGPAGSAGASTVDAISTPVRDGGEVVGSLTFFAPVG
jgi:PAS domain-containing protein